MLATQLTLLSLLLKVYKLGVSVRGCTLDRLPMRTIYSTVCKLREMLRMEWSTHLSIHVCSTITEGAGQFVLLVIYTTIGAIPKATVTGHKGCICKLLNVYYVQYKGR